MHKACRSELYLALPGTHRYMAGASIETQPTWKLINISCLAISCRNSSNLGPRCMSLNYPKAAFSDLFFNVRKRKLKVAITADY